MADLTSGLIYLSMGSLRPKSPYTYYVVLPFGMGRRVRRSRVVL